VRPARGIAGRAAGMIEIIIERWTNLDKSTDYRWSVWRDGTRLQMGGPYPALVSTEQEALAYCRSKLRCEPDRIERL
jgi:hypothetical protein